MIPEDLSVRGFVALESRTGEINISPVDLPQQWKQENIALREEREWLKDELKGLVESIAIYKEIWKKETDILRSKKRLLEIKLARANKKHHRDVRYEQRMRKKEFLRLKRACIRNGWVLSPTSTLGTPDNKSIAREIQNLTVTCNNINSRSGSPLSNKTSARSSPSKWRSGASSSDYRLFSPNLSPIFTGDNLEKDPRLEEQRCVQQLSNRARGGERLGFEETIEAVRFLANFKERRGEKSPQAMQMLARRISCTEGGKLTPIAGSVKKERSSKRTKRKNKARKARRRRHSDPSIASMLPLLKSKEEKWQPSSSNRTVPKLPQSSPIRSRAPWVPTRVIRGIEVRRLFDENLETKVSEGHAPGLAKESRYATRSD